MRDNQMNYPHATGFTKVRVRGERDADGNKLYVRLPKVLAHGLAQEVKGRGLPPQSAPASS